MGSRKHFRGLFGHRRYKTWARRHPWQGWKNDRRAAQAMKPSDQRRAMERESDGG